MSSFDPNLKSTNAVLSAVNKKDFSNIPPDFLNIPPSRRSFFEGQHFPPSVFTDMSAYASIRNFFYYFGIVYNHKKIVNTHNKVEVLEPKTVIYDLSRMMNILQEDNGRLAQVSMQGRLIAESVANFLSHPAADVQIRGVGGGGGGMSSSSSSASLSFSAADVQVRGVCGNIMSSSSSCSASLSSSSSSSSTSSSSTSSSTTSSSTTTTTTTTSSYRQTRTLEELISKHLKKSHPLLCPALSNIDGIVMAWESYNMEMIQPRQKAAVIDNVFSITSYLCNYLKETYPVEGRLASQRASDQSNSSGREIWDTSFEYYLNSDITVWLHEKCLEPLASYFAPFLITSLDELIKLKANYLHPVDQRDPELSLVIDGIPAEYKEKFDKVIMTLEEPDILVYRTLADKAILTRYQVEDAEALMMHEQREALQLMDGNLTVSSKNNRDDCLYTLSGHTNFVWSVCALDDTRIVSGSEDGSIKVWDAVHGRFIKNFKQQSSHVISLCSVGNGDRVASGSEDGVIRVWDIESGQIIKAFKGHTGSIYCIRYLPNPDRLVTTSMDMSVNIWDMTEGTQLKSLQGHVHSVRSVAILGNGDRIASASDDKTIVIWDMNTGKNIRTLIGHESYVFSVAGIGNGDRLVSGSGDTTIKVWDVTTGKCKRTLTGHASFVFSIAVLGTFRDRIVSGSTDNSLKIWDITTGECLKTLSGHATYVFSVCSMKSGEMVISGSRDKTIKVWDAKINK